MLTKWSAFLLVCRFPSIMLWKLKHAEVHCSSSFLCFATKKSQPNPSSSLSAWVDKQYRSVFQCDVSRHNSIERCGTKAKLLYKLSDQRGSGCGTMTKINKNFTCFTGSMWIPVPERSGPRTNHLSNDDIRKEEEEKKERAKKKKERKKEKRTPTTLI